MKTQPTGGFILDTVKSRQPTGSLKISKGVIATIAKTAATETGGVDCLPEMEKTRLFRKGFGKRPIRVALSDDFAEIDVSVVLEAGARIPEVCAAIQSSVKDNVQNMTGVAVSKVNVTVAGVSFPAEA
jgi:uncharacterized alkaline shock family protein YloU